MILHNFELSFRVPSYGCIGGKYIALRSGYLLKCLKAANIESSVFSASLDTQARIKILTKFEENPKGLLITTDLGARGIDFDVPLVV